MFDSLQPHGLQHAGLPCPSPTPGVYPNSCPLSWRCHATISSSVISSPPAFNLSQHQGLFKRVSSSHQVEVTEAESIRNEERGGRGYGRLMRGLSRSWGGHRERRTISVCLTGSPGWATRRSPSSWTQRCGRGRWKWSTWSGGRRSLRRRWQGGTSGQINWEKVETVTDFIFLGSKITLTVTEATTVKDTCSLEEKLWQT